MPETGLPSTFFRLMYVSSGVRLFGDNELAELLAVARRNNAQLGISGMLLYLDGNFLQVLEGNEPDVRRLFATIGQDVRHRGLIVLLSQSIETRAFPDWSMGFFHPEPAPDNERLFHLTRESLRARVPADAPQQIMILMEAFYRVNSGL